MAKSNHRTKGTLRFALKEPNSNTQSPIQLIFSLGDVRIRKSIGYKIEPKYWDIGKQRVKNVNLASNKDEINREINDLENYINAQISELRKTKAIIHKKDVGNIIDAFKKNEEEEVFVSNDFFDVFNSFIEIKTKMLPVNRGGRNQTVEAYKQALKFLVKFQKDTKYKVTFESVDLDFYFEFIDYMQSLEKPDGKYYSLNTIGKHIKTLKTFLNYATNVGVNTNFKYKLSEFKIPKEQTTAVYLTKEEKTKLFEFDFSEYRELEQARDIFIIGCEIGQRISDFNNLNNAEIIEMQGKKYFKLKQKKTGETVYCLITPAISSIMKLRYDNNPPPTIHEQYLNDRIKEAAQMVGINEMVKYERTEGGKKVIKNIPKYSLISSHSARRTFCSLHFNEGVPIQEIMTQSGHKTEKEFKNYIRISKEETVRNITNSERFNKSFIAVG
ncbi:site-specific integrase [Gaetbulibacter saemankumensis]|uniref:site-specific integrase n=1 Tax=Gaetbulibacter saemankumensis TaxID=311208 RepID=UPI0004261502|nr:site-specific integrase [Gaetbulibacter saemankumensis]